jgi:hypothetical protein
MRRPAPLARRPLFAAAFALFALALPPAASSAAQSAKLAASLTPERLGAGTTIGFSFTVSSTTGGVPSPLTGVEMLYPANVGIATSGLGLETCTAAILETRGPSGCPSQSQMGYGSAVVEVPFGPSIVRESAASKVFMAPLRKNRLALVFFTEGVSPVEAQLVFASLILPSSSPFGGNLSTVIPSIPTLPGSPDVSVVKLSTTLGPSRLTFYEHVRRRFVSYRPRGIVLPRTCPRGGFRFGARFSFQDGTSASASARVRCPRGRG